MFQRLRLILNRNVISIRGRKKRELHRHAGPLYLKDLNGCNSKRKCSFIRTPISFRLTSRTNAFRNAPALMHGSRSSLFFAGSSNHYIFCPVFIIISEQILVETGRDRSRVDKVLLSSRFYDCLFIEYAAGNQKI